MATLALFLTVSEIRPVFCWKTHIFPNPSIRPLTWKCSPSSVHCTPYILHLKSLDIRL